MGLQINELKEKQSGKKYLFVKDSETMMGTVEISQEMIPAENANNQGPNYYLRFKNLEKRAFNFELS